MAAIDILCNLFTPDSVNRLHRMAVARGKIKAPSDAAGQSFNSVEALVRLLTPGNRYLLSVIRDQKPQSIAELAKLTNRAASNLTRTLAKLEDAGFVEMKIENRRKVPTVGIGKILIEIDPYSENDRLEIA